VARKTILYVEDNLTYQKMLRLRLTALGYHVITAENGLEGYNLAKTVKPDLVLLDLNMPEMDGIQVCRLLKFDKRLQHIPIVILTCNNLEQNVRAAIKAHVDAFVMKDTRSEVLVQTLKRLLPPNR